MLVSFKYINAKRKGKRKTADIWPSTIMEEKDLRIWWARHKNSIAPRLDPNEDLYKDIKFNMLKVIKIKRP